MTENKANLVTEKIIGCAFIVSNSLGCGFLEKVYENAMVIELTKQGLKVEQQKNLNVYYGNSIVGEYFCDLFIEQEIIVELKTVRNIDEIHKAQLMNYLKACEKRFGLIINFANPKIEIKRMLNGY
ncbi:MAG: GxxExxY protein [bacterium]